MSVGIRIDAPPGHAGLTGELAAALRDEPATPPLRVVVVDAGAGSDDVGEPPVAEASVLVDLGSEPARRVAALAAGWDEALAWPAGAAEFLVRARRARAAARARHEALRAALRVRELEAALVAAREARVVELGDLIAMAVPASRERALRVAALAGRMAEAVDVPTAMRAELRQAALLWEVGRLVVRDPAATREDVILASAAILKGMAGFAAPTELVSGMAEHWDGTGRPGRWLQGQIPFRSRILRVVVDFLAACAGEDAGAERGVDPRTALDGLSALSGTLYDPMVLAELASVVQGASGERFAAACRVVSIAELREGMVLVQDLYAESGVKLLAGGTTVSAAALDALQQRHAVDPILHGAVVRRDA